MKPILFKTEMVEAILEGRKTVTRRLVKIGDRTPLSIERPKLYKMVEELNGKNYFGAGFYNDSDVFYVDGKTHIDAIYFKAPFSPGEVLYVRETWNYGYIDRSDFECRCNESFFTELKPGSKNGTFLFPRYFYRTEDLDGLVGMLWRPSIHMPKEAARIFLLVKEVRAERIKTISEKDAIEEGVADEWPMNPVYCPHCKGEGLVGTYDHDSLGYMDVQCPFCEKAVERFSNLWDSTINKADLPRYGWKANPWVWVVSFERISKEEAMEGGNNERR